MKVGHINFAKGFRGGERQTELLIRGLSVLGVEQILMVRRDSPLAVKLNSVNGLTIKKVTKPYIKTWLRGVDIIHAHEAKSAQWAALNALLTKIPYVITRRVLKKPTKNLKSMLVYKYASSVVCISDAVAKAVRQTIGSINISIIPDMSASLFFDSHAVKTIRQSYPNKFVIGHVGALTMKDKGQHISIETMAYLPPDDYALLFVGDGENRGQLEVMAKHFPNIHFLGFQEDVGSYLKSLDVLLYPSIMEGLGSTIIDAMQLGTPVVASNVGGIPELIRDGENGLLCTAGNPAEFAKQIQSFRLNKQKAEYCKANAKQDSELYDLDRVSGLYFNEYKKILSSTAGDL